MKVHIFYMFERGNSLGLHGISGISVGGTSDAVAKQTSTCLYVHAFC